MWPQCRRPSAVRLRCAISYHGGLAAPGVLLPGFAAAAGSVAAPVRGAARVAARASPPHRRGRACPAACPVVPGLLAPGTAAPGTRPAPHRCRPALERRTAEEIPDSPTVSPGCPAGCRRHGRTRSARRSPGGGPRRSPARPTSAPRPIPAWPPDPVSRLIREPCRPGREPGSGRPPGASGSDERDRVTAAAYRLSQDRVDRQAARLRRIRAIGIGRH